MQYSRSRSALFLYLLLFQLTAYPQSARIAWLDAMNLETMETGWGAPGANKTINGIPLRLGGKGFARGVGTHAYSEYSIALFGSALRFSALAGIDDEVGNHVGSANFKIYVDGKLKYESGVLRQQQPPKKIDLSLAGAKLLKLVVAPGSATEGWDHADWAMAMFTLLPTATKVPEPLYRLPSPEPYLLTPPSSRAPRINGPAVTGARPNTPFLYLIPATGQEPLHYSAEFLPAGLSLDSLTGIVTGSVSQKGRYITFLTARNGLSVCRKRFEIRIGDTLALTPPLGWNSWNGLDTLVTDSAVRAAADAFISKGLSRHGWSYINIDDGWQGQRDDKGYIGGNRHFPDMKELAAYIHARGLRFGIYSSPGPTTCGGFAGSGGFEWQDAERYAGWGVDFLKYDWCSCRANDLRNPYRLMDSLLLGTGRSIVYSLCQYGMGEVWKWGASVGGNSWRTQGDINDSWGSLNIGFSQNGLEKFADPGHWNDPDMMIIGWLRCGLAAHPTRLRPDEQYTHMTLWSIMAAPLLLGCDPGRLDDFTLNLLTNDEVLDVNQDPAGRQGYRIFKEGRTEVWVKSLQDGSFALAFFNRGWEEQRINFPFRLLKADGARYIRDLWRQKELGVFSGHYTASVRPHGTLFLRVSRHRYNK